MFIKKITLAIDETVFAAVRRLASNLAAQDQAQKARATLRQLSRKSRASVGRVTWTREELHDR